MISLTRHQCAVVIRDIEGIRGSAYRLPVPVLIDALTLWYSGVVSFQNLLDAEERYLGRHETTASLARMVTAQSFPPPNAGVPEEQFATVDLDAWPFNCMDWDKAGQQMQEDAVNAGLFVRLPDGHWFDRNDYTRGS